MKTCVEYEMEIMDAFYGEGQMSQDCLSHLATCKTCQSFQESLQAMPEIDLEPVIDEWAIQESVRAAMVVVDSRNKRERWIFLALTIVLLMAGLGLLMRGFGSVLWKMYLMVYLLGPFLLPFMIWKRQRGGQEHA